MCRVTGATSTPRATSSRHELRRERPAGARHLRAARLEGEDGLVGVERPRLGDVAVPDRPPVAAKVVLERSVELDACDGESVAAGETRDELGVGAAWQVEAGILSVVADRAPIGASAARRARSPSAAGVESQSCNGCSPRRASSAAASVAETLTTSRSPGGQEPWKVAETGVDERADRDASRRATRRRRGRPRVPPAARAPPACEWSSSALTLSTLTSSRAR